jgi:hypothetical protein
LLGIIVLFVTAGLGDANQGPNLFSAMLLLSSGAILIQYPAFTGRVELTADMLLVVDRLAGRRNTLCVPRSSIQCASFRPLTRPPRWLALGWGLVMAVCGCGAVSAGWAGGGGHWYWLTALSGGLSLWPVMAARWQAEMEVILAYQRTDCDQPGLVCAWGTPHQAGSLIHTLRGRITWEERASDAQDEGQTSRPAPPSCHRSPD